MRSFNKGSFGLAVATLAILMIETSCKAPDPVAKVFNQTVGHLIGVTLESDAPKSPVATPTPEKSLNPEEQQQQDHRKVNAEFVRELYQSVVLRDPTEEEFNAAMNVIDQGGHYDGLYNGVVYSAEYRSREKGNAPIPALKAYVDVMAQLTLDQRYDPLKIAKPEADTVLAPGGTVTPLQPTEAERAELVAELEKEALAKPFFVLKRRLGEEAMKTIDLKREYKEKLATWYGRFAVYLNKKGVDFGIPARNRADEYYHYQWALNIDDERLRWECLNRLHRLMNAQAK